MYKQTEWQDRVTEFEDRYIEKENPDGSFTHTPFEGEIIQVGTPQNQTNFNNMENGIQDTTLAAQILGWGNLHQQRRNDVVEADALPFVIVVKKATTATVLIVVGWWRMTICTTCPTQIQTAIARRAMAVMQGNRAFTAIATNRNLFSTVTDPGFWAWSWRLTEAANLTTMPI